MAYIFLLTFLVLVSSILTTTLVPSPVGKEYLKLIAKVKFNDTSWDLTIITKADKDDPQMVLYRLPTEALNEKKPRIIVDVNSTPLEDALHLDTDITSMLASQTVLASYDKHKKLVGAIFEKNQVNELDIKSANMSNFLVEDNELLQSAWLSNFDEDKDTEFMIAVHEAVFTRINLVPENQDVSKEAQAVLCTKKKLLYFDFNTKSPCDKQYVFGQDIQGFFTPESFYIFDRENLTVMSFPFKAWKDHPDGKTFKFKITSFDDFFVMSEGGMTTTSTASSSNTFESTNSSGKAATVNKKISTATIIIIVVSFIAVVTLLTVFVGIIIYNCCCPEKNKKKKKRNSKKRSSSKAGVAKRSSKRRNSSAKKFKSKEKKPSKSHKKASKLSLKKESKQKDSKRKKSKDPRKSKQISSSKVKKSKQISSSKPKKSRAASKVSRKNVSVSKRPTQSASKSIQPVSSLFSSRYISKN